jgi:hypothetical protein
MSGRTKRQHFIPRFYLKHFSQPDGELWTHDCLSGSARKTLPEKTALETNIYTPVGDDGSRIELIEDALAKIESDAALIYPDLLAFRKLSDDAKEKFSFFLATMFTRSPAQLRQFAQLTGQMALWAGKHEMDRDFREKEQVEELSVVDASVRKILHNNDAYTMSVDRRVGLLAFEQAETLAKVMMQMTWNYEISADQQLVTSDNPMFWVRGGGPRDGAAPYGFGLSNPYAVIPFPLSPALILRLDWRPDVVWKKHRLERQRAKQANQYRAKYKEKLLFFRDYDEGLVSLAVKYRDPVNLLSTGVPSPNIKVVRKQ